jgi:hypothetical protein
MEKEDNIDIIYKEIINSDENNKNEDKINFKELLKIGFFIIINIIFYIILSFISIELINYLGDKYLLQVNNARLIVSLLSFLGMVVFIIFTNGYINKIINLLIIYDLQKSEIDLLSLNNISKKNIITIIIYLIKRKRYRWIGPTLLLILTFFNNLFFSRVIKIYAINKLIPINIYIPKYTNNEQIDETFKKIDYLENGDTTYIIGNIPNTITWINSDTIGAVNNQLLKNFNTFEILDNITLPTFTSNCILPENSWQSDKIVNISNVDTSDILFMNLTNNEFGYGSKKTNPLWSNGVAMSLLGGMYNSTKTSNRFLLDEIIALRINGKYINNLNESNIYGLTIKCYTILEFISAKIYINGTIINKNDNKIQDVGLSSLSIYGRLNTRNALVRDNILDVQYKPGPIAKSLFLTNNNTLIENISPNISKTLSEFYGLLWPQDAFTKYMSDGLGFQNNIISYSEIDYILLIIWIGIWIGLTLISCFSVYNLFNIEHNEITIFKYIKEENNYNSKFNIHLVKNGNDLLYELKKSN